MKSLLNPLDALHKVASSAGASKSRDSVDNYLINNELLTYGKVGALISDEKASPINGPGNVEGGTVSRLFSSKNVYKQMLNIFPSHLGIVIMMEFQMITRPPMGRIPTPMTLQGSLPTDMRVRFLTHNAFVYIY